ncbi:hypothetical protein HZC53_00535 [Candidatus Uhrbacteria bacterium]|nr:hypothetical protein [Candidatus Uhrbacteria bacterium]
MNNIASKIATYILAPVILGASCLACLLQAAPVYAASATIESGMDQSQDCADYQKPTALSKTESVVMMDAQVGLSGIHQGMTAHADHNCASASENAAFENNARQSKLSLTAPAILPMLSFRAESSSRASNLGFLRFFPQKENFLTDCVIKRE